MRSALAGCRGVDTSRLPGSPTGDLRPWGEDDRPLHEALRRGVAIVIDGAMTHGVLDAAKVPCLVLADGVIRG